MPAVKICAALPIKHLVTHLEVFRAAWDALATGRLEQLRRYLHPDVEWESGLGRGAHRGHDDLERWMGVLTGAWKSTTNVCEDVREVADDCVVAFGRISAFDHSGEQRLDADVAWVVEFRAGLIARLSTHLDRDAALRYVAARRVVA